jgi:hypothetical protein
VRRRNAGASLHLHKGEQLAAAGDQVDFADRCPHAFGKYLPTLAAEVGSGLRLGTATAALRFNARFAQRPSSSARS